MKKENQRNRRTRGKEESREGTSVPTATATAGKGEQNVLGATRRPGGGLVGLGSQIKCVG